MTTRLVHEMVYEAPLSSVAAMLADQTFREQVCAAQNATSSSVSIKPAGDGMQVRIEAEQPTDRVPSFAKKFVGASTTIIQSETWSGPANADVEMEIPGKPGDLRGTVVLTEADGITTETVDLEIRVKIPLIAGKIEELLAKLIKSALKAEHRTGRTYLVR